MAHLWESDHPYLLFRWDWNAWHLEHPEQVRVWLAERARTTLSIWHPILGADK